MIAPNLLAERIRKLEALAAAPGTAGEGEAAKAALERIRARLCPMPAPPTLIGMTLRLDRSCDRRGGCCDRRGVVGAGVGPHRHTLRCDRCGKHRGWLKSAAADLLTAMMKDGRLSPEPILRDRGIHP
jgi:hypothetical protein